MKGIAQAVPFFYWDTVVERLILTLHYDKV